MPLYPLDYGKDTTSIRNRKVARRLNGGAGLIPRLISATDHDPLAWLVVPVGRDLPPYDPATVALAKSIGRSVTRRNPAWNALQLGLNGGNHLNVIMRAAAVPAKKALPRGTWRGFITEEAGGLLGTVHYLSGPPDAAHNDWNRDPVTKLWVKTTPEQREAAEKRLMEARSRGRIPDMQWTSCVPQLKARVGVAEEGINGLRDSNAFSGPPTPPAEALVNPDPDDDLPF